VVSKNKILFIANTNKKKGTTGGAAAASSSENILFCDGIW
jgi:hypothetical protein